MTIVAESFVGRLLAVFSRRSPGFRPPLKTSGLFAPDSPAMSPSAPVQAVPRPRETAQTDPAQHRASRLSLAGAAARWKSVTPQERLQRRHDLLAVARSLESAATALNRDRDRVLDLGLGLAHGLVRDLVRDLARSRDLDLDLGPDPARDLDRDLDRALDLALARSRNRDLDLDIVRDLDIDIDLDLVRDLDLDLARDLVRDLDSALDRARFHVRTRAGARNRARNLDLSIIHALSVVHALSLVRAPEPDHVGDRALDFVHELARDFTEAHDNLIDAASDFVGADLTTVDLVEVNLAGIRWDSDTQWPAPEWTARIRRASMEDPPGSGVLIVLPEEGHDFADHGSLAPMS
ncbi:hypothetical protein ABTX82_37645 [Streptomyces lavendulae]|uniref:hypothetical protein n=1 Tax=Streptomyces lavendulae TaxID=1914 RepID=UPI0033173FE3